MHKLISARLMHSCSLNHNQFTIIGDLPTRSRIMDTFQSPDQFSEPYYNRRDSMAIRVYTYLTWTYMKL